MKEGSKVILLILILFGALYVGHTYHFFGVRGYEVLSIDSVRYINTTENPNQWLINVVVNGGGNELMGSFNKDYFNNHIITKGVVGTKGFGIKIENVVNKYVYTLRSQTYDEKIYKYNYHTIREEDDRSIFIQDARNHCYNKLEGLCSNGYRFCKVFGPYFKYQFPIGTVTYYKYFGVCFKSREIGKKKQITPPHEEFSLNVVVYNNNGRAVAKINNKDQKSAILYAQLPTGKKKIGTVTWVGNLWAGYFPPSESSFVVIYNNAQEKYYVVGANYYSDYTQTNYKPQDAYNYIKNLFDRENDFDMLYLNTHKLFDSSVNGINTLADRLIGQVNEYNATVSGTTVVIPKSYPTSYPNLKLQIDANWIGIKKLIGEPKVKCSDVNIRAGGTNHVKVATVKNKGDSRGSFSVSISCPPEVYGVYGVNSKTDIFEPGESKDVYFDLTSSRGGTFKCQVKALDMESAKSDICYNTVNSEKMCNVQCPDNLAPDPVTCKCICPLKCEGATIDNCKCKPVPTEKPPSGGGAGGGGKAIPLYYYILGATTIVLIGAFAYYAYKRKQMGKPLFGG